MSLARIIALLPVGVLLVAPPASAEWVDWIADAGLTSEWNDNLNNSAFGSDRENDFAWRPALSLGRVFQFGERMRLSGTVDVEGTLHHRYERLNSAELGGTLAAFYKFGTGDVPFIRVHGYGGHLNLREDERDSVLFETGVETGMRFSPRLEASIGYLYTDRNAANGGLAVLPTIGTGVFDQSAHNVFARGSFLLTNAILFSAGYQYRNGEFDSACTAINLAKVLARERSNVEALRFDTIFGHAALPGARRGCVYRLEGDAHTASADVSYGIGERASVNLGYQFTRGQARRLIYRANVVRFNLMLRY